MITLQIQVDVLGVTSVINCGHWPTVFSFNRQKSEFIILPFRKPPTKQKTKKYGWRTLSHFHGPLSSTKLEVIKILTTRIFCLRTLNIGG